MAVARLRQKQPAPRGELVYIRDPYPDDEALLAGLRRNDDRARSVFFERHGPRVERLLYRVLGPDGEVPDLVQDIFVAALAAVAQYRGDGQGLAPWLASITVFNARRLLRRRTARAWLRLEAPESLPEVPSSDLDPSVRQVLVATYAALAKLPANERIVFSLKYVAGMSLPEISDACRTSRATVIRRLAKARRRFESLARTEPALREWLDGRSS